MEQKYTNLSGHSGVQSYEIGADHIWVRFRHGGSYRYSKLQLSTDMFKMMTKLAIEGCGLNTFINKFAKKYYDQKRA